MRARLLDVSEGGLCVAASVRFKHKMTVKVVIDDPRHGPIEVEAVVWHERRFRQPSSGARAGLPEWCCPRPAPIPRRS